MKEALDRINLFLACLTASMSGCGGAVLESSSVSVRDISEEERGEVELSKGM